MRKSHRYPNLDAEREKRGMTQKEFSAFLGITPDSYCDRQRGRVKGTCRAYWQRYADILGVPAEYLSREVKDFHA